MLAILSKIGLEIYRPLDLLLVLGSFIIGHWMRFGTSAIPVHHLLLILVAMLLFSLVFSLQGIYRSSHGNHVGNEVVAIISGAVIVLVLLALIGFFTQTSINFSRIWVVIGLIASATSIASSRLILRKLSNYLRTQGFNHRTVLIVGAGEVGTRVASRLNDNHRAGLRVIGFLDDNVKKSRTVQTLPILGDCANAYSVVEEYRNFGTPIDQVWIALPGWAHNRTAFVLDSLSDSATSVSLVPDFLSIKLARAKVENVASIPLISLSNKTDANINFLTKHAMDYVLALVTIFLLSPLLLIIAILIKIDSKGPVLFKQNRYGLDGCEILVWKFRTMKVQENGPYVAQAKKNDPRVTTIGKVLRKTSLDELPQLFNVLAGTMSLVGPRPHAVAHNEIFRKQIPYYMRRHVIKPGITGLAQVSGCRGETETLEKMQNRIDHDLTYINDWSIIMDVKILLATVFQIFKKGNSY